MPLMTADPSPAPPDIKAHLPEADGIVDALPWKLGDTEAQRKRAGRNWWSDRNHDRAWSTRSSPISPSASAEAAGGGSASVTRRPSPATRGSARRPSPTPEWGWLTHGLWCVKIGRMRGRRDRFITADEAGLRAEDVTTVSARYLAVSYVLPRIPSLTGCNGLSDA
jgi:hypothetical protein